MATGNFVSHENGIFVVEQSATEEQAREMILANDVPEEEITEQFLQRTIEQLNEMVIEDFIMNLPFFLNSAGYTVFKMDNLRWEVWNEDNSKIVAELRIEAGYYEHYQVIVETDKDYLLEKCIFGGYIDEEDNTDYISDETEKLFKLLEENTTVLSVVGRFSNGGAVYEKK